MRLLLLKRPVKLLLLKRPTGEVKLPKGKKKGAFETVVLLSQDFFEGSGCIPHLFEANLPASYTPVAHMFAHWSV